MRNSKLTDDELVDKARGIIRRTPDIFEGLLEEHCEKFWAWLEGNGHVIRAFGKYAMELRTKGNRKTYSCYTIRERLRWDTLVQEVGTEFKISNNITPHMSRLLMKMNSRLDGMFVTKKAAAC